MPQKENNYWTYEMCKLEAFKYNSRMEFKNASSSAYSKSVKLKWLNDICIHMPNIYNNWTDEKIKPNGYWNILTCAEEALKYKYKIDFKSKSESAYTRARKDGFLNEICKHMTPKLKNKTNE